LIIFPPGRKDSSAVGHLHADEVRLAGPTELDDVEAVATVDAVEKLVFRPRRFDR
jgi:hypothetical protein